MSIPPRLRSRHNAHLPKLSALLLLVVVIGSGSAQATPPPITVTPPDALLSQTGSPALFTNAAVSGFAVSDVVRVVLGVDSGNLELTSSASGVSVPTGYPAAGATGAGVAFEGTQAQVNSALAAVEWIPTAAGTATLSFSATLGGAIFDAANGHYYQSVNNGSALNWSTARTAAATLSFNGYTGYLATITSKAENDFLAQTTGAASWIGASEDSAFGAPGSGSHTGNYTWVTGPEAGTVFWNSGSCPTGEQGVCSGFGFAYFNAGEPNNSGGGEHYIEFNAPLNSGRWNDLANTSTVTQYLVEFGSPSETATLQGAATQTFTGFTVPGAPTGAASVAGAGQATISFTPPVSNGGSTITGYEVRSSSHGAIAVAGGSSPIVVTGLTNGLAYTFTVVAINAAGDSVGSGGTVVTPIGPPDPPTGAAAVRGDGQATVTFTPPGNNGGHAITSYTVTASPDGVTAVGTSSPIVVHGLTNGTLYTFTVTATSDLGTSLASGASAGVTPAGPPGAPTGVTVAGGSSHALVSFSPAFANGSAVTSYVVTSSPGSHTCSPVLPATSCDVLGLTNGTAYTFTVVAANGVGTGVASAPAGTVVPAGAPGRPTAVSVVADDESALVSFAAPSANGAVIVSYTVTVQPGGATFTWGGSPIRVTGLTNGVAYTFTVVATNGVGSGLASDPSGAVTPVLGNSGVAVSETVDRASIRMNGLVVYTITAANAGPHRSVNVVVTDALAAGARLMAITTTAGSCSGGASVVCSLGELAAGSIATIRVTVRLTRAGAATDKVGIKTGSPDLGLGAATSSAAVQVLAAAKSADLALSVSTATAGVAANRNLVYTFRIKNIGPGTATGVELRTKLLRGVAPLVSGPRCVDTGHLVCALRSLASGKSVTLTIVVHARRLGRYDNDAVVAGNEHDPVLANNKLLASTLVAR